MPFQNRLDRLPISFRRWHNATGAEHRLADKGRNRLRPFGLYQRVEHFRTPRRKVLFAHRAVGAPIVIGRFGMQYRRERKVKSLVEEFQTRERSGHEPRAVIAAPAGDDLLLLRPAEDVVVVPDQLDVGLVGIGAGKPKIDVIETVRRALSDHTGERDGDFGAVADISMVIGQLARLFGDRLGDFGPAIADIDAVEPGKGVEASIAVTIDNIYAFATFDHTGRAFAARMLGHVG